MIECATEKIGVRVTRDVTRGVMRERPAPELKLEDLLAFCRQNLRQPKLSPRRVASHFGISVRTLHLRFEPLGQSFGRWLLQARLDACTALLREPQQGQGRTISDIAYGCGFNDLSHFNKAFRARFGMSPRRWRAAAIAAAAPRARASSARTGAARRRD